MESQLNSFQYFRQLEKSARRQGKENVLRHIFATHQRAALNEMS